MYKSDFRSRHIRVSQCRELVAIVFQAILGIENFIPAFLRGLGKMFALAQFFFQLGVAAFAFVTLHHTVNTLVFLSFDN